MNKQRLKHQRVSTHLTPLNIVIQAMTIALLSSGLILTGCSDDDGDDNGPIQPQTMAGYDITVTNLTARQPLSPVAAALHSQSWQSFSTGQPASTDLEQLAEGGDNTAWLATAGADASVYDAVGGTGPIPPGNAETINMKVADDKVGTLHLSLVSMLVNTNDAFAAVNHHKIADMAVGDKISINALSYDSGTEANSESADTLPGPAARGGAQEGFAPDRDDVRDAVFVHAGAVTADEGLTDSVLSAVHRWDHPAIRVTVERVE